MRKLLFSLALFSTACTNLPYRVVSKVNDYVYFQQKYEKDCGGAMGESTKDCVDRYTRLVACKKALEDSAQAAGRGGAAKYQEKEMGKACRGLK
jgi:hypothetical protein